MLTLPIYIWHFQGVGSTENGAVKTSIYFLRNNPTFSFDGISGSIEVLDVIRYNSYPVQYFITVGFKCGHEGFGDRTGEALPPAITPHSIVFTIENGNVIRAVIDDMWDEMNQETRWVYKPTFVQYIP